MTNFDGTSLKPFGLNLSAVININSLPEELIEQLKLSIDNLSHFTQLVLIGHGGNQLWSQVKDWQQNTLVGRNSINPIDDFSVEKTRAYFEQRFDSNDFKIVYPKVQGVGLQTLGKIAGWHHDSPMKIGINQSWGTWYAYRCLVAAKSHFKPSVKEESISPCNRCIVAPCVNACPIGALDDNHFDLELCLDYRRSTGSDCVEQCLARRSCYVGKEHEYSKEQLNYHYKLSFETIKQMTK